MNNQAAQTMQELLPCPFCGNSDTDKFPCEWLDWSGGNVIRCAWCHGAAPAKTWNRRATAAALSQTAGVVHLRTGVPDKDGREICVGDRIVYRNASQYTKEEYWNPEYVVEWKAPSFVLRHVGGGKNDSNASFAFNVAVRNPYWAIKLETIAAAPAASGGESWRCFYCDEVFTDRESAHLHFGAGNFLDQKTPGCQIDIAAYRAMEETVRRYQEEDADIHRAMHRMAGEHALALRREEEKGYARGMRDAETEPNPPSAASVSERARAMLAAEFDGIGMHGVANDVRMNKLAVIDKAIIRALEQALTQQRGEQLGDFQDKALAWDAVCDALGSVSPMWGRNGETGLLAAVNTIRSLATTTPQPSADAVREYDRELIARMLLGPRVFSPESVAEQARLLREADNLEADARTVVRATDDHQQNAAQGGGEK